jgi:CubicO group peptidase (beta-lactamase class C family)
MDSRRLAQAVEYLIDHEPDVHSLHVVRGGYLVTDVYFHPYEPNTKHDIASVTKSIMSTIVGIAIDGGYIRDVRQSVLEIFPEREVANVDARKQALTIEDLLTMSAGFSWGQNGDQTSLFQMMQSPDWVQFVLDLPMSHKPGERFEYNSGGVHLLSAIVHESTGMTVGEFARRHLFEPLGVNDIDWPTDPWGRDNIGWGNVRMRPHDMLKVGYLYLNGGRWKGERVLSERWVDAATSQSVALDGDGYGYLWWIESGTLSALGRGGQNIFVLPDENMVVVFTGGGSYSSADRVKFVDDHVVAALSNPDGPNPPDDQGTQLLETAIQRATSTHFERQQVQLPATAREVSGTRYALQPNQFGIIDFVLKFDSETEATLEFTLALDTDRAPVFRIGLDGVPRQSEGRFGIPAAATGRWEAENSFAIALDEIGNINKFRITATFDGDAVTLTLRERTGLGGATIRGSAQ